MPEKVLKMTHSYSNFRQPLGSGQRRNGTHWTTVRAGPKMIRISHLPDDFPKPHRTSQDMKTVRAASILRTAGTGQILLFWLVKINKTSNTGRHTATTVLNSQPDNRKLRPSNPEVGKLRRGGHTWLNELFNPAHRASRSFTQRPNKESSA